jgi:hypothetical protein
LNEFNVLGGKKTNVDKFLNFAKYQIPMMKANYATSELGPRGGIGSTGQFRLGSSYFSKCPHSVISAHSNALPDTSP